MNGAAVPGCALCDAPGGRIVVQSPRWRVVHAEEAGFPAFYRVVWQEHVREYSQLPTAERHACIDVVATVEQCMLRHLSPAKVNLATLGNMVPHLHWHVIARFEWDSHFPGPVWAGARRTVDQAQLAGVAALLPALEEELLSLLSRAA